MPTSEITPPPNLRRDLAFLAQGDLLAHGACEQQSSLSNSHRQHNPNGASDVYERMKQEHIPQGIAGNLTFGSMKSGTPKSTAFLLIT